MNNYQRWLIFTGRVVGVKVQAMPILVVVFFGLVAAFAATSVIKLIPSPYIHIFAGLVFLLAMLLACGYVNMAIEQISK